MTATARSQPPKSSRGKARPPLETVSPASPTAGQGGDDDEDDAASGEWLFKENDLVLGPVSAAVLVERIKKGELTADTPVARDGQPFRSMKLVRLFREAWEAIEEEERLAAEERAYQRAVGRAGMLRVVVVLLAFVIPFVGAAAGARVVMIKRPWDDTSTMLARVPPLIDLPQKPPEVKVAQKTPDPAPRAQDDDDEDAPSDPGKPRQPRPKKTPTRTDGKAGDSKAGGSKAGDTATTTTKTADKGADDGARVQEGLTNAQAIAPLKGIQDALKACFKAELDGNPNMPSTVTVSYTVTEEGKAINIDLEQRELRGRPVVGCVRTAMGGLRWPKFTGERKNISVPFKLSKPSPPK